MVPATCASSEIDDCDGVAGVRISAVDAVAINGNVGELVVGRNGEVVRRDAHFDRGLEIS